MRKRRAMQSGGAHKQVKLGTEELTRLWNCGSTDVDELTDSSIPTLSDYLGPAMDQMKEGAAMTEEERKEVDQDDLYKNDKLYVWRALRLMAKSDVKAFEKLTSGEDMDEVLKAMAGGGAEAAAAAADMEAEAPAEAAGSSTRAE